MLNESSFITVQAFMRTKLQLKGYELMAYALVYGFSQDGRSWFSGSRGYIAEWLGCSVRTVANVMDSLTSKGLVIRHTSIDQRGTCVRYRAVLPVPDCVKLSGKPVENDVENSDGVCKNCTGGVQKLHGGCAKTARYNIEHTIEKKEPQPNEAQGAEADSDHKADTSKRKEKTDKPIPSTPKAKQPAATVTSKRREIALCPKCGARVYQNHQTGRYDCSGCYASFDSMPETHGKTPESDSKTRKTENATTMPGKQKQGVTAGYDPNSVDSIEW